MNKKVLELLEELQTTEKGLTIRDVRRKQIDGKNELPKIKKDSLPKVFFKQFLDSIILIMFIAAIVSVMIHEIFDAIVIILIILLDAIMGTIQEWKASKNAAVLENMIKVVTIGLRDGKEEKILAEDLVIGDIIYLQSGDRVPADSIILSCNNFTVDESALTGESVANQKHAFNKDLGDNNMVFAGTNIMTGRATCVIKNIGINTEIGKIASAVSELDKSQTPLTIRVNKFSKQISIIILILAFFLTVLLLTKDYHFSEIILSVVALTVSAMPEGLPLALTLALTIGSNRMSKKNIIVKKLKAVESLGSCTVIATDKTGTLTVNEQTAKKIVLPNNDIFEITGTGYNNLGKINGNDKIAGATQIAKLGVLNNEASLEYSDNKWISYGDSIDIAFLALGKKLKIDSNKSQLLASIPYESENKYSAVFYQENETINCTAKGSLEVIFEFCDSMYKGDKIVKLDRNSIIKQNEMLAAGGYRVIAIANNEVKQFNHTKDFYDKKDIPKLVFCGLVAFIDPIRKETLPAIRTAKKAGIEIVMITGDHPLTAFSIARELNLTKSFSEVATGEEIQKHLDLGDKLFDEFRKTKKIFARVTPIQKLKIVESFKRNGEFVAVTGDGVNDAPAIKIANIGIAMGSGTDVAKETSSMIITDDNFLSIVSGIEEGRNAYANIRKVIYMLISCGIAEVFFFILAILTNMPMPLIAVQLLWLNVVTDGLQDLALSFEKLETDIMEQKPRDPKEPLFDKTLISEILLAGLSIGSIVFIIWLILINILKMDLNLARGYIMTLMVFMQNVHVLNCRSEHQSTFKISIKSNPFIILSIIGAIILQIIVIETPFLSRAFQVESVPFNHLLILFLSALPILIIMELYKYFKRK